MLFTYNLLTKLDLLYNFQLCLFNENLFLIIYCKVNNLPLFTDLYIKVNKTLTLQTK